MSICLDRNEFFFQHAPQVQAAWKDLHLSDLSKYSTNDSRLVLEKMLAGSLGIETHQVQLGIGSEEILQRLLSYFRLSYENLIFLEPSWPTYHFLAKPLNYEMISIEYSLENPLIQTPWQELERQLSLHSKSVCLLASPNNPTGHELDVNAAVACVKKFPGTQFIFDIVYDQFDSVFIKSLLPYSNVVMTTSFSKFFGLPGLRLGYAVSQQKLGCLYSALGPSPIALSLARAALAEKDYYAECREKMLMQANAICQRSYKNFMCYPSGGPFVFVRFHNMSYEKFSSICEEKIKKFGIKPKMFSLSGKPCLRWSLGSDEMSRKIDAFLADLDK